MSLVLVSCDAPSSTRAFRVSDRVQLVGGPSAIGELGDFVLENDQIRAVILQGGNSVGPGMFGGTLVDLDLRRPELSHSSGRGNDQLAELFPMVNLVVPGYQDGITYGVGDLDVSIWSDGNNDRCPLTEDEAPQGCASIRVAGRGDRIIEALGTVEILGVPMDLSFITYYILRPGDRYIRIRTFFWDDLEWTPDSDGFEPGSDDEPQRLVELSLQPNAGGSYHALQESVPIFDVLVGDLLAPLPAEVSPFRHPGYLAGDFLLLGKNVSAFGTSTLAGGDSMDRSGFDVNYIFQRRYDRGEIVLASPLTNSLVVGVGDRVSYGYLSTEGSVVIPILTSSFTGAFTHSYQCVTENNREDCGDEMSRPLMYDRFMVVGGGDAASVLETYFEMTGTATGRVSGHVLDVQTGDPVAQAEVFALLDPRERNADADISTYEAASTALRAIDWNHDGQADGNPSIISFASVEAGVDRVPDASWSMRLEPGQYLLVPFVYGRRAGRPVPVTIEEGEHHRVSLALDPPARFNYEITDDRGDLVTAKLTLIGPLSEEAECPSNLAIPELSSLRYLELGMSERPQGIAVVVYSETGEGTIELAPGRYDVIASRGFEYSIDRRCLDLRHDTAPIEQFSVLREVDTTGWVAGDFHVHGVNSYDGNMPHRLRVISSVAEGIEVFSTTDHDYITNLEPIVFDMNMRDQVSTMVGIETTPIELGHILGYPIRFDETEVDNGGLDWTRRDACLEDPEAFGCPESSSGYLGLTPQEIFDELRAMGEFGPDHTVVTVPHPRDGFFGYFDQYALNQFDLSLDPAGLVRGQNPLLASFPPDAPANERYRLFSESFDAIELFNGMRYEFIRTPTVDEVTSFVTDLSQEQQEATSELDYARQMTRLHDAAMRRVLVRTAAEQARLRPDRVLECRDHSDCDEGELCDPHRYQCIEDAYPPCSPDSACPAGYICQSSLVRGADGGRCIEACASDDDCRIDEYCQVELGVCQDSGCNIDADGLVVADGPEAGDRPCVRNRTPHASGVVDDWFRLLNYGVAYTGMGNSDTHTPSSEIGLPRNFVMSSVDAPAMIDRREIADNIRAYRVVASYGPFIEFHAQGGGIGDTVRAQGAVELQVRVQSASWFDVDRIEVYANGDLFCDLGVASTAESRCPTDAELAVGSDGHNTNIVNFDGTIDVGEIPRDTWFVVVAMGVSEDAWGLSPVYFAGMHPQLGFTQVIGQAFASFDLALLRAVVPPPVARSELTAMVPYAITNPIWVESDRDDDDLWTAPLGIPGYRRVVPCQFTSDPRGCLELDSMPLSTESLGTDRNPLVSPTEEFDEGERVRQIHMIQQSFLRMIGGGC
jgi:hypothetical protein